MPIEADKEIRYLEPDLLISLIDILSVVEDDWKKFMSLIPIDPQDENSDRKYNDKDIRTIEQYAEITQETSAKIMFNEWASSGSIYPTLRTVQKVALNAEMIRLADEIAKILEEPFPPRPTQGPGAPVTTQLSVLLNEADCKTKTEQTRSQNTRVYNDKYGVGTNKQVHNIPNWELFATNRTNLGIDLNFTVLLNSLAYTNALITSIQNAIETRKPTGDEEVQNMPNWEQCDRSSNQDLSDDERSLLEIPIIKMDDLNLSNKIEKSILEDTKLSAFDYYELLSITDCFSDHFRIDRHGFSEVFKAPFGLITIKKMWLRFQQEDIIMKMFNTEIRYLSQFRHANIVPIVGFAVNGPHPCIICEYVEGGSLMAIIAEKVLNEREKISIMRGTAEGLRFLHSNGTGPGTKVIHGDVKSKNILLTKDFVPKLSNFSFANHYEREYGTVANPFGTIAYMPPEAIKGIFSQKTDSYGFGIVLLELLTGLKPSPGYDQYMGLNQHVNKDMKNKSISDFLDPSTQWTKSEEIYFLAKNCLDNDMRRRPTSEDIYNTLTAFELNW